MKTLLLNQIERRELEFLKPLLLLVGLVLCWPLLQKLVRTIDVTAGYVDLGILVLVLLSLICFLVLVALAYWLMGRMLVMLGLPAINQMVLQFRSIELCYQLGYYLGFYALLLLAAVGCLIGIC